MTAPSQGPKGAHRRWWQGKSAAMADTLRGIAAMEDVELPMSNDVGMLRNMLKTHVSMETLNRMLTRAALQYEAANKKPRK